MASSVDRSFCIGRCSDRGICYSGAGDYFCVCYDVAVDPTDCSPLVITTVPDVSKELDGGWLFWTLLIFVGAVLASVVYAVVWLVVRYWRSHRFVVVRVDEEGESARAVPKAPPLEGEEVAVN